MKTIYFIILLVNLFWASSCLALQSGEGVVLDPATGDYIISYRYKYEPGNPLYHVRFIPSTKIDPTLLSRFHIEKEGQIRYSYTIINGAKGRQALVDFGFGKISSVMFPGHEQQIIAGILSIFSGEGLMTPAGWDGEVIKNDSGYTISWMPHNSATYQNGLLPGKSQSGFGFASPDLPGLGMAEMSGNADVSGFPNEGPEGEILDQYLQLQKNNFLYRPAAVPMVAVPVPFDPATLLDRIQTQTHIWIAMQLLDATLSSQLDRYLVAAADAYRHNQPKAGKEHIETVRKMLKKEHEDLGRDEERESENNRENDEEHKSKMISRLAARVLDFDLRYVLKRMDDDGDHERDRKK